MERTATTTTEITELPGRNPMRPALSLVLPALIVACLGLAACNAAENAVAGAGAAIEKTAQKVGEKTEATAEKVGQGADDAAITVAVKGALLKADERLGKLVHVSTGNNIVSLAGAVPTAEDKAKAEQIAAGVKGVTRVINGLDVGAPK
jgi:hyperosmotically inducible protein